MSAAPDPFEPAGPAETPELTEAAQVARRRLQEEIERVRKGVEEMIGEQEARGAGGGRRDDALRSELERLRIESRDYTKKKVRRSEKKLRRAVRELDARADQLERRLDAERQDLERRIDEVKADREAAEWRIHNTTEQLLDGLLGDVRAIADRLADSGPQKT